MSHRITDSQYIYKWKLWNRILNGIRKQKGLPLRDDIYPEYNIYGGSKYND